MTKRTSSSQHKRIEEISLFLKNWRINECMSQSDFARLAQVHPKTIFNIEKQKNFSVVTLFQCISATGLKVSQFFESMD